MQKLMVLIAPNFLRMPLAVVQEMHDRESDFSALALVTGRRWVYDEVQRRKPTIMDPVDFLDDLEKRWVKEDQGKNLRRFEEILGTQTLNRIVVSDRHLGHGFISGSVYPDSWLRAQVNDPSKLRNYLSGLLTHIDQRLSEHRPDLVFCYAVAGAPAYALHALCNYHQIPFRRIALSRIGTRRILEPRIDNFLSEVDTSYRDEGYWDQDEQFLPEAKNIIREFRDLPDQPDYSKRLITAYRQDRSVAKLPVVLAKDLLGLAYSVARGYNHSRVPRPWSRFKVDVRKRFRLIVDSKRLSDVPPKGKFVYYPLHVDPEASTMVMAPDFTNQLLVIEAIAKALPWDLELVVKEHVPMIGNRPSGFYEHIERMPRVKIVDPMINPFHLIKQSELVCTITGTAVTEALLLGKPVLIFSKPPFDCLEKGFTRVKNLTDLVTKIPEALAQEAADDVMLERYVASILKNSIVIPSEKMWGSSGGGQIGPSDEHVQALCEQLEKAVRPQEEEMVAQNPDTGLGR